MLNSTFSFSVKAVAEDWVKVGTMLMVSQWLNGGSLLDGSWQQSSLFTLLGFTAYQLATRQLLTPSDVKEPGKSIIDDTLKFGTMFVVSRLLSGQSLADQSWISASIATLVGFAVYNIVVATYVKGKDLTYNPKLQMVVDDWMKVGTMLAVSRIISCESLFDPKWVRGSLATIIGFSTYDLVTSHIIDKSFKN